MFAIEAFCVRSTRKEAANVEGRCDFDAGIWGVPGVVVAAGELHGLEIEGLAAPVHAFGELGENNDVLSRL